MVNCNEVIELMQRHLDGDLNQEEQERMTDHLKACPECTLMMERLAQIDQDLANLPKVTPAFSIVDSILPRLQQIDAEKAAAPRGQPEAAALEGFQDGEQRRADKAAGRRWRLLSRWYQLGGLAACAAVLGILIINGLPEAIPERSSSSQQESSPASAMALRMAASGSSTQSSDDKAESMASIAEVNSMSAMPAEGDASMGSTSAAPDPLGAAQQEKEVQNFNKNAPVAEGGGQAEIIHEVAVVDQQGLEPAEALIGEETEPMLGIAGFIGEASAGSEDSSAAGFTVMEVPSPVLASEDGALSATIELIPEDLAMVVVKSADDAVLYTSSNQWPSSAAVIDLVEWKDSTLIYQVRMEDELRIFAIDMTAASETEINLE